MIVKTHPGVVPGVKPAKEISMRHLMSPLDFSVEELEKVLDEKNHQLIIRVKSPEENA